MKLTLEQKVGQTLFVGIPGATVDAETRQLLTELQPGGVVLFARNIESGAQVAELTKELRGLTRISLLISIDQEGGRVDRLKKIFPPMPSAEAQRIATDAAAIYQQGALTAEVLRLLGVNMNFAPVLDICHQQTAENGLQERYFGSNAGKVIRLAGAYLEGLQNNGVIGCGKHFPGLGDSSIDSHAGLPQVTRSRERLWAEDLMPYRDVFTKLNARLMCVMVSHAHYKALDNTRLPASLSHNIVTKLLREELDFKGLVVTDDMEMGAIIETFGFGEACRLAIEAGQDMLTVCQTTERAYEAHSAIVKAVRDGKINEHRLTRSLDHIASIKSIASSPHKFTEGAFAEVAEKMQELSRVLAKG